jgi:hypothetical protein
VAASLRLPTLAGCVELDAPPGVCETCRELPAGPSGYCSALCAGFDAALRRLARAYRDADDDKLAPAVVAARTALRAIADVYDERRIECAPRNARQLAAAAEEWERSARLGELLPVPYRDAIRRAAETVLP